MDYTQLLKRGIENLPDIVSVRERFEIPKIRGHHQGVRTVVSNLQAIANAFNRELQHMLKYLLRELATSGDIKGAQVVFNSKLNSKNINEKIRNYANIFVLCYECGKPDTKLISENSILYMKCQACGIKNRVRR